MCWQMDKDSNILVILVFFYVCAVHLTQPPEVFLIFYVNISQDLYQWRHFNENWFTYFPLLIHFLSKIIP